VSVAPAPGAHGGDAARLAAALRIPRDEVLDLSVSLNPWGPDVATLVRDAAPAVRDYPDPAPATIALAAAMRVDPDRLVLTNGGAEAIALVATARPCGWVDEPDFSLYARHLRHLDPKGPRWRSNPHNPSGRLASPGEQAAVWDEAFYPLATGTWTRGDEGVHVVGSLTKLYACPGLRIGYVLTPTAAAARGLRAAQPEWSVNALAVAVLPDLLAATDLARWSTAVARHRDALVNVLARHGLRTDRSDANFVLVRGAAGVRERLARRGVLVRDTTSFGIPGGVRIAVPDDAGLAWLAGALEER
jgi:histidinol-phosphate/aromatic aminotransferase/cobyric acid decarboxylase-like protein